MDHGARLPMLYRPLDPVAPPPRLPRRLWQAVGAFAARLGREASDARHLDTLSPTELHELGLRRLGERDYPSLR